MPDQIMFKGNQVLFRGDKVSFCVTDCNCIGNPDPPPPPPNDCPTCPSKVPCSYFSKCTPAQLQVTFDSVDITGDVIDCASGQSVSISGTLDGPYTLLQDPAEPCRWLLEILNSPITATRYTETGGGGTSTTTNRLRIAVQRVPDGLAVSASMIFDPYVEFMLFLGPLLMNSGDPFPDKPFTVTGYPFAYYCTNINSTGGRLGNNGTATVSTCGPVPPPSSGTPDSADTACKIISPLTGMLGIGCWSAGSGSDTTALLQHIGDWHWELPGQPIDAGNGTLVEIFITYETDFLTYGSGWFITLKSNGIVVAYYRKYGFTANGGYNQVYSTCPTLPPILNVDDEQCPIADCTTNRSWPSSIAVKVTDTGPHPELGGDTWPDITGTYVLLLDGGFTYDYAFTGTPTALDLTVKCYGDHWEIGVERTTSSLSFDDYFSKLPQKDNGPPRGVGVPYRSDPPLIDPPGPYADAILEIL